MNEDFKEKIRALTDLDLKNQIIRRALEEMGIGNSCPSFEELYEEEMKKRKEWIEKRVRLLKV